MSDHRLACVFVKRLLEQVKQLIQASLQMDAIAIDQLLAQAWEIMKAEIRSMGSSRANNTGLDKEAFYCSNHFAKDCMGPHVERQKS